MHEDKKDSSEWVTPLGSLGTSPRARLQCAFSIVAAGIVVGAVTLGLISSCDWKPLTTRGQSGISNRTAVRLSIHELFKLTLLFCEDVRPELPKSLDELADAFSDTTDSRLFVDPWGQPFRFRSLRDDFELSSLGADGKIGGEGEDADYELSFRQWCSNMRLPVLPF